MKIVLVAPRLDHGGGQRFVAEMGNYWVKQGFSVSIICLRNQAVFYDIEQEIKIYRLNYKDRPRLRKTLSATTTLFRLRKKLKELSPEVVLSHLGSTNILTLLASRNLSTKVYIQDVMSPLRAKGSIERFLRKKLYPKAAGIMALTDKAKELIYKETNHDNIQVIPNPIMDLSVSEPPLREKFVINVGRMVPAKGQEKILEACAKINNSDWKFVILGDGPLRPSLEKKIKKLNIQDNIEMPGSVKNVKEWLLKSSIFVLSSNSEGLPIALMEAMAAGLACVSFDCVTGPAELIVDGENGFLVPVNDMEMFTQRIETLMEDTGIREQFSERAKHVGSRYTAENISERIFKMIENG